MKRIDIKLSLPVVAPLIDVIREASGALRDTLASPVVIDSLDTELRDIWSEDLLQAQNLELRKLIELFDGEFFSTGMLRVDEASADAVMRASSALRLQLRRGLLRNVKDEELESGQVEPDKLPEAQQSAFLCYIFLATLQELMIQHMSGEQGS